MKLESYRSYKLTDFKPEMAKIGLLYINMGMEAHRIKFIKTLAYISCHEKIFIFCFMKHLHTFLNVKTYLIIPAGIELIAGLLSLLGS